MADVDQRIIVQADRFAEVIDGVLLTYYNNGYLPAAMDELEMALRDWNIVRHGIVPEDIEDASTP